MEIKIGIADSNRELVVQSKDEVDTVKKAVADALAGRTELLELTDEKGKQYLDMSGFSRSALIDQLVFEGFTPEQAAAREGARAKVIAVARPSPIPSPSVPAPTTSAI